MILDSSAIVAVMLAEPGYEEIRERIGAAEILGVGAPTVVESGIVLSARIGRDARPELNEFLRVADAEVIPFGLEHSTRPWTPSCGSARGGIPQA
jgi:ribonuclease VapC